LLNVKHSALLLGLSAIASTSVFATSAQAASLVTSLPIEFVTTSGGFTAGAGAPNPVTGISASINSSSGAGSTIPFNPSTGGAIITNFIAANATGSYGYSGYDAADFLRFDLLAGNNPTLDGTFSSVFGSVLASGNKSTDGSFNFDLSSAVAANANKFLAVQFSGSLSLFSFTELSSIKLLFTTKAVPEPSNLLGMGLLGVGIAASLTRKKLQAKTKVAA